jgi:uncharacterized protein YbbC (DUF1343 family)
MAQTTLRVIGGVLLVALAACRPAGLRPVAPAAPVRPGLEVLATDSVHLVRGLRVGLVSNQAGVDRDGRSGVELLRAAGIRLVALFSPEHGFRGAAAPGEAVSSSTDPVTGLPIYSLYGRTMAPSPEMLDGLDVILVDLQDVGARYFTWLGTTVEVMRAAGQYGKPVIVLDRPNPIGSSVRGNVLDTAYRSMVGMLAVPMQYGMTLGELALLARSDFGLTTELHVIPVAGWRRDMTFNRTGLPFVPPSPNLRDLESLFHYPGLCLFEGTALSVGRGTDLPFHQIGAPWLDTTAVLARMRSAGLSGVRFAGIQFTPRRPGDGKYADTTVVGVRLTLTDPRRYDPVLTALTLLAAVRAVHPERVGFVPAQFDRLAGGPEVRSAIESGVEPRALMERWSGAIGAFDRRREPYLLYR